MTGYESKRAAARDKLDDDDALTIAYQSGYYDGKKAAQPAQEPVAWYHNDFGVVELSRIPRAGWKPLTTPPQRTWAGLTEEEISEIRLKTFDAVATNYEVYRAIEAKLKAKNT